jgi:hypothetical protein
MKKLLIGFLFFAINLNLFSQRLKIQDYPTVLSIQNETQLPKKGDKIYIKELNNIFNWDGTSPDPDDGILVIQQTNQATGRWIKIGDAALVGGTQWVDGGNRSANGMNPFASIPPHLDGNGNPYTFGFNNFGPISLDGTTVISVTPKDRIWWIPSTNSWYVNDQPPLYVGANANDVSISGLVPSAQVGERLRVLHADGQWKFPFHFEETYAGGFVNEIRTGQGVILKAGEIVKLNADQGDKGLVLAMPQSTWATAPTVTAITVNSQAWTVTGQPTTGSEPCFVYPNFTTFTWEFRKVVGSASANNWGITGNTGLTTGTDYLGTNDAVRLDFRTNATNRMSISATGNVGIGTTTPNVPLQFANNVLSRKIVFFQSGNNDHEFFGFGMNPSMLKQQVDASSSSFGWFSGASPTSSNELMRLTGGGNLGIGISTPSATLDVSGTINNTGNVTLATSAGSTTTIGNTTGAIEIKSGTGAIAISNDASNTLLNIGTGAGIKTINFGSSNGTSTNNFVAGASGITTFSQGGTERMRLHSNGFFGVGANTPTNAKLEVENNDNTVVTASGGVATMRLYNAINGANSATRLRFQSTNTSSPFDIQLNNASNTTLGGTVSLNFNHYNTTPWTFNNGATLTERMRISGTGQIGIGTNAPTSTLHLTGSEAKTITTTAAAAYTALATDNTIYLTLAGPQAVTLPNANTCPGRIYRFINRTTNIKTISNYTTKFGNTGTFIYNRKTLEVVSDGVGWLERDGDNNSVTLTQAVTSATIGGVTFTITLSDPMVLTTSVAATGHYKSDIVQFGANLNYDYWINGTAGTSGVIVRGNTTATTTRSIGIYSASFSGVGGGILTANGLDFQITSNTVSNTIARVVIQLIN